MPINIWLNKVGELAEITKAVADEGGYISACGNFHLEDTAKAGVILKVRNVDQEILIDTLSKIEALTIIDIRKM